MLSEVQKDLSVPSAMGNYSLVSCMLRALCVHRWRAARQRTQTALAHSWCTVQQRAGADRSWRSLSNKATTLWLSAELGGPVFTMQLEVATSVPHEVALHHVLRIMCSSLVLSILKFPVPDSVNPASSQGLMHQQAADKCTWYRHI